MSVEFSFLGQILAVAFASGLNLYATVAVVGLASRLGWITSLPPGLLGLENGVVIASALALFLIEFVVDKVPHVDSLWDTVHTLIRPTAAALLVLAATDGAPWPLRTCAAVLAGLAALAAHGTKAGLRMAITAAASRRAVTFVSLAEDSTAVTLTIVALAYPKAALGIAAGAAALVALFGPRLWRAFVFGIRALVARLSGFFGTPGWRDLDAVPRGLRARVQPEALGTAQPHATRVTLSAPRPIGAFRNGWLISTGRQPVFVYRARFRNRQFTLPEARELRVRRGIWADAVEIETDRFRCTVFALKDGPPVEAIIPDLPPPTS